MKFWAGLFTILISLSFASAVSAIGGGSGGGTGPAPTPTCTSDTYECSDWGTCSIDGTQDRTCALVDDCPSVNDPAPPTSQECTPDCTEDEWECEDWSECTENGTQQRVCVMTVDCPIATTTPPPVNQVCELGCMEDEWECDEFSECSADGEQRRTCELTFDCPEVDSPVPATSQSCSPTCTEDIWECGDWSGCDIYGNEVRQCEKTLECRGAVTESPETAQRCQTLQCDNPGLYDRVFCRLNLAPSGIERELEIEYLPEPCRGVPDYETEHCVELYRGFQECWQFPVGDERIECAKRIIGVDDIQTEKEACNEDEECLDEIREKVYELIIFRFYDLESRAEAFALEGVTLDTTARFVTNVIQNKIAFYNASSYEERKAIIEQMRIDWQEYVVLAREQLGR